MICHVTIILLYKNEVDSTISFSHRLEAINFEETMMKIQNQLEIDAKIHVHDFDSIISFIYNQLMNFDGLEWNKRELYLIMLNNIIQISGPVHVPTILRYDISGFLLHQLINPSYINVYMNVIEIINEWVINPNLPNDVFTQDQTVKFLLYSSTHFFGREEEPLISNAYLKDHKIQSMLLVLIYYILKYEELDLNYNEIIVRLSSTFLHDINPQISNQCLTILLVILEKGIELSPNCINSLDGIFITLLSGIVDQSYPLLFQIGAILCLQSVELAEYIYELIKQINIFDLISIGDDDLFSSIVKLLHAFFQQSNTYHEIIDWKQFCLVFDKTIHFNDPNNLASLCDFVKTAYEHEPDLISMSIEYNLLDSFRYALENGYFKIKCLVTQLLNRMLLIAINYSLTEVIPKIISFVVNALLSNEYMEVHETLQLLSQLLHLEALNLSVYESILISNEFICYLENIVSLNDEEVSIIAQNVLNSIKTYINSDHQF